MPLSCSCDGDYDYYVTPDNDFSAYPHQRGRRCPSCNQIIKAGADVLSFECYTHDENGDEKYRADQFLCEACGGLYMALAELGYCVTVGEDLRETARQYGAMQREIQSGNRKRENLLGM